GVRAPDGPPESPKGLSQDNPFFLFPPAILFPYPTRAHLSKGGRALPYIFSGEKSNKKSPAGVE
ncbi:MAG: hypothetical protein AB1456_00930, partial [Thermodesulfobacteriota bacterium]